jgi:hypothetical protein
MPKKNPLVRASADEDIEDDNNATSAAPGWLTKGKANIKEAQEANKAVSGGNFIPEFWLRNGEMAVIRIPMKVSELEVSVARHNVKMRSKGGKPYFKQFTCSGDADTCHGCKMGDKASIRWPLVMIDHREIEYQDYDKETKTKKKVKRSKVAKLWLPSIQELDNMMAALEDYKLDKQKEIQDLSKYLIRVRRVGEKAKTSYKFTITGRADMDEKEITRLAAFTKEYGTLVDLLKPIPLAAQRKMMGAAPADEGEDESEADVAETTDVD